ncbi:MAG: Gfo/Idh/MocA family protein [Armatimonadota bacterium]
MADKVRVAIAGCGNVAKPYANHIKSYPHVELVGFFDLLPERAAAFVAEHGGKVYSSLEALLADASVDLVVNLTIHHAHAEVVRKCLEAGKHVHTEKPLALSSEEAAALVQLAEDNGLRLSSAPITFMGEAQQTAWKYIRDGKLGPVRVIYAEVNHGRIEGWHPNPEPFYQVGALWDVGVYPLTLMTTFFGPVIGVTAVGRVVYPDRVTTEGRPFHIDTPDFVVTVLEFAGGQMARLTTNFYIRNTKQGGSLEFHGDAGSLYLENFQSFGAAVEYAQYGADPLAPVELVREPFQGIEFGRGVDELATAILENRPQRATGKHAAHVIDILDSISRSLKEGRRVEVTSTFTPPQPMEWAEEAVKV